MSKKVTIDAELFNTVMEYRRRGPTIDSFGSPPVIQRPYTFYINNCAYTMIWDTKTFSEKNNFNATHSV